MEPAARGRIDDDGTLKPFVPFEVFGDPDALSDDRDSQGDVWYADMGTSSCPALPRRARLRDPPPALDGAADRPDRVVGGRDVDYEWQLPAVEFWLTEHGVKPAEERERVG